MLANLHTFRSVRPQSRVLRATISSFSKLWLNLTISGKSDFSNFEKKLYMKVIIWKSVLFDTANLTFQISNVFKISFSLTIFYNCLTRNAEKDFDIKGIVWDYKPIWFDAWKRAFQISDDFEFFEIRNESRFLKTFERQLHIKVIDWDREQILFEAGKLAFKISNAFRIVNVSWTFHFLFKQIWFLTFWEIFLHRTNFVGTRNL